MANIYGVMGLQLLISMPNQRALPIIFDKKAKKVKNATNRLILLQCHLL